MHDEQRERLLAEDDGLYPPRRSPPRARRRSSLFSRSGESSRAVWLSRLCFCFSLAFLAYVVLFHHQERAQSEGVGEEWQIPVDLRQSIVSAVPAMLFRDNLKSDKQYFTALFEGDFDASRSLLSE